MINTKKVILLSLLIPFVSNAKRGSEHKVVPSQSQIKSFLGGKSGIVTWKSEKASPPAMQYVSFSDPDLKIRTAFSWSGRGGDYSRPKITADGTRIMFSDDKGTSVHMARFSDNKKGTILSGQPENSVGDGNGVKVANWIEGGKEYIGWVSKTGTYRIQVEKGGVTAIGSAEKISDYSAGKAVNFVSHDLRFVGYGFQNSGKVPYTDDRISGERYKVPWSANGQRCQSSAAYSSNPYTIAHMQMPHTKYHLYRWDNSKNEWKKWKSLGSTKGGYEEINWGTFSANDPNYFWSVGHVERKVDDFLMYEVSSGKSLKLIEFGTDSGSKRGGQIWIGTPGQVSDPGPGPGTTPPPSGSSFKSIKLNPPQLNLEVDEAYTFQVKGVDSDDKEISLAASEISWKLTGGGTIDKNGKFVAGTKKGGPFEIQGTYKKDGKTYEAKASIIISNSLEITAPTGTGSYRQGEVIKVRWDADVGSVNDVEVFVEIDGKRAPLTLAESVREDSPNWGKFDWTVSSTVLWGTTEISTETKKARIQIRAYGGGYERYSDYFEIKGAESTLLESLAMPQGFQFTWQESGLRVQTIQPGEYTLRRMEANGKVSQQFSGSGDAFFENLMGSSNPTSSWIEFVYQDQVHRLR